MAERSADASACFENALFSRAGVREQRAFLTLLRVALFFKPIRNLFPENVRQWGLTCL